MPHNDPDARIAALSAENKKLKADLSRLRADHKTLHEDYHRSRGNFDLLLHAHQLTAKHIASGDWVAEAVLDVVRHLAAAPDQVRRDRTLSVLSVDPQILTDTLNARFFNNQRVIPNGSFSGSTLVGAVIHTVRAKL